MIPRYPHFLSFPFRIGGDGRTARTPDLAAHVRDELVQLILTGQGERLFLPEFGTNVRRLVFENIDDTTKAMTKSLVTQAISRWLGERVTIESLEVTSDESKLQVDVQYRPAGTEDSRTLRFQRREI